jgi:DNA polymerase
MDKTTRLHYLQTMGVETWQLKSQPSSKNLAEKNLSIIGNDPKKILAPTFDTQAKIDDNWVLLAQEVGSCQKCDLYKTRKQTVFGAGNFNADWLFIGEAPGENEDLQGLPFVGNAGLLLTEMIRALGLKRDDVFIANILKCRPPNNRDPKVNEITACHDYLKRQQALINPKIIIAVGRVAAQKLLKSTASMKELRGVVHKIDNIPLVVIYHPAYLLRFLGQKRVVWQDLLLALKTYQLLQEE